MNSLFDGGSDETEERIHGEMAGRVVNEIAAELLLVVAATARVVDGQAVARGESQRVPVDQVVGADAKRSLARGTTPEVGGLVIHEQNQGRDSLIVVPCR